MILAILLINFLPSAPLSSTLVVVGKAPQAVIDRATLTDELGARLPELELTFASTPIPGAAFTLVYESESTVSSETAELTLILTNREGTQLLNRTLNIRSGDVSAIREVAVFIEGVIRRQADSLADMVAAHAPKPEPPSPPQAPAHPAHRIEADLGLNLGTLFKAGRSTLGTRAALRWNDPDWLRPTLEIDLHTTGTINSDLKELTVTEWTIGPMLNIPLHSGDIDLTAVGGPALTLISGESRELDETFSPGPSSHFTLRLGGDGEWEISNNIKAIAGFRLDFSTRPPIFALRDSTLLNRGPVLISFGAGLRFGLMPWE